MNWTTPEKPAEFTENRIIEAILNGYFPIDSTLPAERELSSQLGVTRPTLREALQRLSRDGWLDIQQGKPTRVCNYLEEGNLGVLSALARFSAYQTNDFIPNLLSIRILMAPSYTRLAIEKSPQEVASFIKQHLTLAETKQAYASFDWEMHHKLTILSKNPIFTLILNGFRELYYPMACVYFQSEKARNTSKAFYHALYKVSITPAPQKAEQITKQVMEESLSLWIQNINHGIEFKEKNELIGG
jgi:GntR family transcriptional regulator, negative regulator for fad regulon and positive regulator of fabA